MVIYLTHTCCNQYLISIGSDGVSVFLFFLSCSHLSVVFPPGHLENDWSIPTLYKFL